MSGPDMPRPSRGEVLVVQPIHESGLARLTAAGLSVRHASSADMRVVADEIGDAVAVITRSAGLDASAMRAGRNLRVIGSHGSGVDAIDLDAAERLGIRVVRTPGANATAVAEMTLTLTLATLKRVCDGDHAVRQGDEDFKYRVRFGDLAGATVGIVGLGAIGRALASMLRRAFDVQLLVHTRTPDAKVLASLDARIVELPELASCSDVVTLHRPADGAGRPVIDDAFLDRMKRTAILVNTSRGSLVDEDALARALGAGRIAGAGLDVVRDDRLDPESALASAPNLVLSPHVAGSSVGALRRTGEAVADAVVKALEDGSDDVP